MKWVLVWYSLSSGKPVALAFADERSCRDAAIVMSADPDATAFCFQR